MGFDRSMCSAEWDSSLYSLSILIVYHLAFWLNIFSHTSVGFEGIYVVASAFTFAHYIIIKNNLYKHCWPWLQPDLGMSTTLQGNLVAPFAPCIGSRGDCSPDLESAGPDRIQACDE